MFDGVSAQGFSANIGAAPLSHCEEETKKKNNLKIKFTEEEDAKLHALVMQYGAKDWIHISQLMGTRNPRQCRERWNNYVNPALRTDPWTAEEDMLLDQKIAEFGPKWNKIAKFFRNRSDNSIRNRWMMMARHRAKHQKSPMSPAPTPTVRIEPVTPMVVMPVVKEFPVVETRLPVSTYEQPSVPLMSFDGFDNDQMGFDMWNDFSFF